jgi:hypothetical protein
LQPQGFSYPATPKDLWLPSQKCWNNQLIDSLFMARTANVIKNTIILQVDNPDTLCWRLTPNGKCNTKSAYKSCLQVLIEGGMPGPAPVDIQVKQILKQVSKSKAMIPRVKTFLWRILRSTIPSGDSASRFSTHIEKHCSRCGLPETDFHLFFLRPFAKAAWFISPWFLKSELFAFNANSMASVLLSLLSSSHPEANLESIGTFLWCLWKARNDHLFGRKKTAPEQISIHAKALLQDLEVVSLTPKRNTPQRLLAGFQSTAEQVLPNQGETVHDFCMFAGNKVFVDAAWKLSSGHMRARPGIGVYLMIPGEQGVVTDVFVSACSSPVVSVIQAEAQALLLAGHIVSSMMLSSPVFFTDNLNLARTAAAPGASSQASYWEIRRHAIEFQNTTALLAPRIFHVQRNLNVGAHYCAKQAKTQVSSRPIRSCGNLTHRSNACPVLVAIDRLHLPEFVIQSIRCL